MTNEMNVEEPILEKPSLFGMIMNPGEQFKRIKENPKFIVALIVVTVLTVIGMGLMLSGMDFLNDPSLEGMGEDEMMMVALIGQITFVVTGLFTPIFSILISTVVYLIFAKIARSEVSFKQLFSMTTYIFIISAISLLINGLAFMIVGDANPEVLFTSVNSIIGAEGVLGAFLSTLEIFTIWGIILSALGLQLVAKFSKGLSWSVVIGIYVVTTIFSMVAAGFSSMLGV